jgi:hypothetical protein
MTFTLGELCVRPSGEDTERAWRALENSIHPWAVAEEGQKHLFQNVVRKLYVKAQKRRQLQQADRRFLTYDTPPELNLVPEPPLTTMSPSFPPQPTMGGIIPTMAETPQILMSFPQTTLPEYVSLPEAVHGMLSDGMTLPFPAQPLPDLAAAGMHNIPHNWTMWNDIFRSNAINLNAEIYGDQQNWYSQ